MTIRQGLLVVCLIGLGGGVTFGLDRAPVPPAVSILELVANPQKYDGKRVVVVGYFTNEFEDEAVYLHREDYEFTLRMNGLELHLRAGQHAMMANRCYAEIEGQFRAPSPSDRLPYGGHLASITRIQPWLYAQILEPRCKSGPLSPDNSSPTNKRDAGS